MSNGKVLVVFGGGEGSLGDSFLDFEAGESAIYRRIINFSLPQCDCTSEKTLQAIAPTVHDLLAHDSELHVVNFVGMMDNGKIEGFTLKQFERVMTVNLHSLFLIAKAMMPLLTTHQGRFITMGSNSGEQGFTGMSAYCASKFAVQGFVQCMAKECAPFNVPVNVVNPGAFALGSSAMSTLQVEQFMTTTGKTYDEVMEMLTSRIPMKRLATNDDLNSTLHALLNVFPRFYTGQSVSLSGGQVMGK
jgi:NAD(P)-dependent dehydrogenase (short-subunit alcohol dehydrogenase family)